MSDPKCFNAAEKTFFIMVFFYLSNKESKTDEIFLLKDLMVQYLLAIIKRNLSGFLWSLGVQYLSGRCFILSSVIRLNLSFNSLQ